MAFMASPAEDIKARLDIVEYIRAYVRLEKAGMNFKAACPFHNEKTPSFFVSPSRQIWHCFGGCGEGGDIFTFAMKIDGLDFPEALRLLAARAGVEITREDPRIRSERNRLYDVAEAAANLFERSLLTTDAAKEYLRSRGLTEETVRGFRVGWAPESWDWLLRALAAKGFRGEEAEKAGLALRSGDGSGRLHDRFRSRIIFPITDANARVIGFGGRILQPPTTNHKPPTNEAKYINTPQTALYDKSRALYGFDKAKQAIREKNRVVVTEGYMDCIMSHQAGVAETIAVSGTALTVSQLTAVRRLCDTVICSFDADAAGDSATRRSLALAARHDFARRIAVIPSGKDPADTVRDNPEAWRRAVEDAKPVVAFYFDKSFAAEDPKTAEGKKKIAHALLPFVAELSDEIEKAHWVGELARRLGILEEAIWKQLRAYGMPGTAAPRVPEEGGAAPSRRGLLEERFLAALALAPEGLRQRELATHRIAFSTAQGDAMFRALTTGTGAETPELAPHLERLRFTGEVLRESIPDIEKEFVVARRELEKLCISERLADLEREIGQRERGAPPPLGGGGGGALWEEFKALSDVRQSLS